MAAPPRRTASTRLPVARVQRPLADLPVLHLEAAVPTAKRWTVAVDGLVETPLGFSLEEIREMPSEERVWDLHCVWGWTRPACRWEGVPVSRLIDARRPKPGAEFVFAAAIDGPYGSCLTMEEARESLLAWRLDGEDLTPEHGWPLRLVTPPHKWGYKSVKWIGRLTLTAHFSPGFWEDLVGNPSGDIPPDMLDLRFE